VASSSSQLAAYLPVHEALESGLTSGAHPAFDRVWDPGMRRVDLLRADLDALDSSDAALPAGTRTAAASLASWIGETARVTPIALLGVLYVLEGSTLGGAVLRRHLAAAFGLTDAGLRYYSPYGTHPKPHWVAFSERMNAIELNVAEADAIVEAARETFERIGAILVTIGASEPVGSAA
jgi:heme oxygenase